MRIAFISDIHGHAVALEAVLEDMAQQQVDRLICLGDIATIGPQPRQVIARLQALDCACIMGNHDAALLQPEKTLDYQIAPLLLPTLHWCQQQLIPSELAYLRSFKPATHMTLGPETTLLCFHGSPASHTGLILATTPPQELDDLLHGYDASIWVGGHTHVQMLRQHQGQWIVNPGSVGQAFRENPPTGPTPVLLPQAEYAIVSWIDGALSVELRRISFDLAAFFDIVAQSDIPIKAWWLEQYAAV